MSEMSINLPSPRWPKNAQTLVVDVDVCARCEQPHGQLAFSRMQKPPELAFPFWALCPSGSGPLTLTRWPVPQESPR